MATVATVATVAIVVIGHRQLLVPRTWQTAVDECVAVEPDPGLKRNWRDDHGHGVPTLPRLP